MKKMIRKQLCGIIVIGMLLVLGINYYLQVKMSQQDMREESELRFLQIKTILSENAVETEELKEEFRENCIMKARAAAYIIENQPDVEKDQSEIKRVAELLQIDELHLFNTEGTIYTGSEPKYFGYNFNSGEQMQFFLPMLTDQTLELCQDITPNTAEGKYMQYSAVWRKDGKGIIQIGMEPTRVLEVTRKNKLSNIFPMFVEDEQAYMCAADPETYEVLGATDKQFLGKTLMEMGVSKEQLARENSGFRIDVKGKSYYCVFTEQNGVLLGRAVRTDVLYKGVNESTMFLAMYLLVLSIIMIAAISVYLDKKIIRGIAAVNSKLQSITDGDLDERVDVHETPEFTELSGHVNQMVGSILDATDKLSSVLDMAEIPIGAYEYNKGMRRVRTTSKVAEILGLSEEEKNEVLGDSTVFREKLAQIGKNPVGKTEDGVFLIPGNPDRYIKIEFYERANSTFGVLMDMTKEINARRKIEQERDEDLLTGLYNRRSFYQQVSRIFQKPEQMKHAAVIMIDTDNLKMVNDKYGHEVGDYYLRGMADIIRTCVADNQVSARLSGDEFAMLLYGYDTKEEVQEYVDELARYQDGFEINDHEEVILPVKFSMGTAFYPEDGETYQSLLKCADKRMYQIKRDKKKNPE